MKKLISILLTAIMVLSMTTAVSATDLNEATQETLELKLFEDIFLGYDEFTENIKSATLADDSFYRFKGFKFDSNLGVSDIEYPLGVSDGGATMALVIKDAANKRFERTVETTATEGKLTMTSDGRYDFTVGDTTYHLGEIATGKKTGNAFFPGQKYDTSILKETIDSSIYTIESGCVESATYPVDREGLKSINILSTSFVNKQAKIDAKTGTGICTNQADGEIIPVTVNYADGEEELYYIANGTIYLDFPYSIRVADKQKAKSGFSVTSENYYDLAYTSDGTNVATGYSAGIGVEYKGEIFDINGSKLVMPSASEPLANTVRLAQSFKSSDTYGRYSAGHGYLYSYEIPVKDGKKVESVKVDNPVSTSQSGLKEIFGSGNVEGTYNSYIKFASDNTYDYYFSVYCKYSGSGDSDFSALFGITLKNMSYAEKIEIINESIVALNESSVTPAQIAEIDEKIQALKAENSAINDSDFNISKLTQMKEYLKSQVSEKIEEFKNAVEAIDGYTYEIKDIVISIKADYEFIKGTGTTDQEIGTEIVEKFNGVYAQYEEANAFEEMVDSWSEYTYSMYEDVTKAYEKLEEIAPAISSETAEAVEEYYEKAVKAKAIDDKIAAFGTVYNPETLEELLLVEAEVNEYLETEKPETLKELANLKALMEFAQTDILNRDIESTEEKINDLPSVYTTAIQQEVDTILAELESITERGGQVNTQLQEKINNLVAQMNETPYYIIMDLEYTRDVMEDKEKYASQAILNEEDNTYTYPVGSWGIAVSAISSTTKRAFDEADFVKKLGLDADGKTTINSVPYQFGEIVSAVNGIENEPNSLHSGDANGTIVIDVENAPYSELYLAAWSGLTNNASAEIIYSYSDGTTSTDANITKFKGGTTAPKLDKYTENLSSGTIAMFRGTNGSDKLGGYNGCVISHRLTPNDTKILETITIKTSNKELNIFALTGKSANSVIMQLSLDETMDKLENTQDAEEIRSLIYVAETLMEIIEEKGMTYNQEYKETTSLLKEKYIELEDVICYTDLDMRNITVKFSGELAEEYFTKEYFKLTKDSAAFDDYTITKVSGKEVLIKLPNKFDYDSEYVIEISKNIMNKDKSVALDSNHSIAYNGGEAVEADVSYESNKVSVYAKNNTNEAQMVTVMIGSYDEFNTLVGIELVEATLNQGEAIDEDVVFNPKDGKIRCIITDNINNGRLLYNQIDLN